MTTKKVVKKKTKQSGPQDLNEVSFADLYSMYLFVSHDANNRGFGKTTPEAKTIVRQKLAAIEEEIYMRLYGFNPFTEFVKKAVVQGQKPEDIDLDRFVVAKGPNKEPENKKPETFVVAKNKTKG